MDIDPVALAVIGAVIAGITELFSRLRARDFWVAGTIAMAAVVGLIFGLTGYFPNVDAVEGTIAGFATSGAITVVGSLGRKSTPQPSTLTERAKE